jgi:Raf kinase inhibitor-like YbhB/YbcL family protein
VRPTELYSAVLVGSGENLRLAHRPQAYVPTVQREGKTMKKAITWAAMVVLITIMSLVAAGEAKMKITSSAFQQGGNIPSKFTCDESDTSPPLQVTGIPSNAKTLVLIADDPDAPGGLFTHWLVWNIPAQTNSIAEGSAPKGVHGTNDFGKSGYKGPCPPPGTHRYSFKIFALDRELDLRSGAKRSQLDAAMKGHVIAQGELVGRYARKK